MPNGTRCPYCFRPYALAGALNTHIARSHYEMLDQALQPDDPTVPESLEANIEPDLSGYDSDMESLGNGSQQGQESPVPDTVPPEYFPGSGAPSGAVPDYERHLQDDWEPWAPFSEHREWCLARWFLEAKTSKSKIDEYFNSGLHSSLNRTFQSAYTLGKCLDRIPGWEAMPKWQYGSVTFTQGSETQFFYRDIVACARYLISQRCYTSHMVYKPIREYDSGANRLFSGLHTADWWWELQSKLPAGATIVPIICGSDATQLTNFSGDKKAWPVYLTIGNLPGPVRNSPSAHAQICVALLPVPPKFRGNAASQAQQRSWNFEILYQAMTLILDPLRTIDKAHGIPMPCADGRIRKCWPILVAWLADHAGHCTLQSVKNNLCPKCEVRREDLGTYIDCPASKYPRAEGEYEGKVTEYECLKGIEDPTQRQRQDTATIEAWFDERGLRPLPNPFWGLPFVHGADLHKPDTLHVVYLGILKHLMDWLHPLLQDFG